MPSAGSALGGGQSARRERPRHAAWRCFA